MQLSYPFSRINSSRHLLQLQMKKFKWIISIVPGLSFAMHIYDVQWKTTGFKKSGGGHRIQFLELLCKSFEEECSYTAGALKWSMLDVAEPTNWNRKQ